MANERGVLFGSKHSYDDWGLHMIDFPAMSPPTVQSLLVNVPGRDGKLNLSKALDGSVHYTSRKCSLKFDMTAPMEEWARRYSEIQNYLHGQEVQLVLDSDPSYYYQGVMEVVVPKYSRASAEIEITGDLDPYKYERFNSLEDWMWDPLDFEDGYIREYGNISVSGTTTFEIIGNQKPVTPTITVADMTSDTLVVALGEATYTFTAEGTKRAVGIILTAGSNKLTLTGTATVSILYEGGSL